MERKFSFILTPRTSHLSPLCGFTFIELIFVTLVMSILLMSAAPRFHETTKRLEAEHTAFALAQQLRYAHTLAVANGQPVRWAWVAKQTTPHAELAIQTGAQGEFVPLAGRWSSSRPLPGGLSIQVTTQTSRCCVTFLPDGTSDAATIILSGTPQWSYQIAVDEPTSQVWVGRRISAG